MGDRIQSTAFKVPIGMPRPRFGGYVPVHRQIDAKARQFQEELQALAAWDRQEHTQPVIQRLDIPFLVRRAKQFLARQSRDKNVPTPFLVGIAGGSASGKTYINHMLSKMLPVLAEQDKQWSSAQDGPVVEELTLDNYFSPELYARRQALGDSRYFTETNLDEPAVMTLGQMVGDVMRLKNGRAIRAPWYDFRDSHREEGASLKVPAPFVFIEGLYALAHEKLRQLADLRIFVNADEPTRIARFWKRAPERNLKENGGTHALLNNMLNMHRLHVEPSQAHANLVLNGAAEQAPLEATLIRLSRILLKTFYPPVTASSP